MTASKKNRIYTVIGGALAAFAMTVAPASAAAGSVSSDVSTANGSITATCAFGAQLISLDPDVTEVAIAATANAVARKGANPVVSTAVNCFIRGDGSGGAGITSLGPTAAIAGQGSFNRVTTPDLCVQATASYLNGTTESTPLRCTPINASVVIDPADLVEG